MEPLLIVIETEAEAHGSALAARDDPISVCSPDIAVTSFPFPHRKGAQWCAI